VEVLPPRVEHDYGSREQAPQRGSRKEDPVEQPVRLGVLGLQSRALRHTDEAMSHVHNELLVCRHILWVDVDLDVQPFQDIQQHIAAERC